MKKHIEKIVDRIHSSPSQAKKVIITICVYSALFLVLLHTRLVKQQEFLQEFSSVFLSSWFLCALLALLLLLFLLKDSMPVFKEVFINTAESIYGSIVLITAFALSGYLYSIPPSRKMLLVHKTNLLMAVIVYFLIAVFLKKIVHSMTETRKAEEKIAFIFLVCASFALTWFVRSM